MRKALAVLFTAILCMAGLATMASPANAWHSTKKCVTVRTTSLCYEWKWTKQNDDSGVHVDGLWIDITTNGQTSCNGLEDPYPSTQLEHVISDQDGLPVFDRRDLDSMPDCHVFRTVDANGPDVGAAEVAITHKIRVNNAPDWYAYMECDLHPTDPSQVDCRANDWPA